MTLTPIVNHQIALILFHDDDYVKRFDQFEPEPGNEHSKQALLAFNGDVYLGLKASDFDKKDLAYAQKHLRIISGGIKFQAS